MPILDTSVLVGALSGSAKSLPMLTAAIERDERMLVPALVFYEWLRGPRMAAELAVQQELMPLEDALPFGELEAAVAADLYRSLGSGRRREIDLAIAAHVLVRGGELWTLNERDFSDIPDLRLYSPR